MTEIVYWEDLARILDKVLACELEENAKALSFLKVRPHRSSIVQSYGRLKIFCSNMKTRKYSIWELGKQGRTRLQTRSTLKEVFPRGTCGDLRNRPTCYNMAVAGQFAVVLPLNNCSSASRCDGGS